MKISLSSNPEYSALWLRDTILGHLMSRMEESPAELERKERLVWKKFIQNVSGEYDYDSVLETYENLSRRQFDVISDFIDAHAYEPRAIWTIARAAHLASTGGNHYIANTVFLYDSLAKRCPVNQDTYIRNNEWNIFWTVCGLSISLQSLPEHRQKGHAAVAEFLVSSIGNRSEKFVYIDTRAEIMVMQDKVLKSFIMEHYGELDKLVLLANERPELNSAALVSMLTGEHHHSLTFGVL